MNYRSNNMGFSGNDDDFSYLPVLPSELEADKKLSTNQSLSSTSSSSSFSSSTFWKRRRFFGTIIVIITIGYLFLLPSSSSSLLWNTHQQEHQTIINHNINEQTIEKYFKEDQTHCPNQPGRIKPQLERHDHNKFHGDVCRNIRDRGYVCPINCVNTERGVKPFCLNVNTEKACRVPRSQGRVAYRCDVGGGERGVCLLTEDNLKYAKYADETCDGQCGTTSTARDSAKGGSFQCRDDWDCSLSGTCNEQGVCLCDDWAEGHDCSYLKLQPVDPMRLGYIHERHSSWGGSVVKASKSNIDQDVTATSSGSKPMWHMFVSEIVCEEDDDGDSHGEGVYTGKKRCGLEGWQTRSRVVRAVSYRDPAGPYIRVDKSIKELDRPQQQQDFQHRSLQEQQQEEHLQMHEKYSPEVVKQQQQQQEQNQQQQQQQHQQQQQQQQQQNQHQQPHTFFYSHNPTVRISPQDQSWNLFRMSGPDGPTILSTSHDDGISWTEPTIIFDGQNPSPLLSHGSFEMYHRIDGHEKGTSALLEPTCSQEYIAKDERIPNQQPQPQPQPQPPPLFGHTAEDPFVFIDARGYYHMFMNALPYKCVPKYLQGGHAWSRGEFNWKYFLRFMKLFQMFEILIRIDKLCLFLSVCNSINTIYLFIKSIGLSPLNCFCWLGLFLLFSTCCCYFFFSFYFYGLCFVPTV